MSLSLLQKAKLASSIYSPRELEIASMVAEIGRHAFLIHHSERCNTDFRAAAFFDPETCTTFLVFCGTRVGERVVVSDLCDIAKIFLLDNFQRLDDINSILNNSFMQLSSCARVECIGHSLGAIYADVVSARIKELYPNIGVISTTFDSPGSKKTLYRMFPHEILHTITFNVINSSDNCINTVFDHITKPKNVGDQPNSTGGLFSKYIRGVSRVSKYASVIEEFLLPDVIRTNPVLKLMLGVLNPACRAILLLKLFSKWSFGEFDDQIESHSIDYIIERLKSLSKEDLARSEMFQNQMQESKWSNDDSNAPYEHHFANDGVDIIGDHDI